MSVVASFDEIGPPKPIGGSTNSVVEVKTIYAHECQHCKSDRHVLIHFKHMFVGRFRLIYMNIFGNLSYNWAIVEEPGVSSIKFSMKPDMARNKYSVEFEDSNGTFVCLIDKIE